MKWAIAGKGGVGKTTICAGLARALAAAGRRVVLIDADPDPNLAGALGLPIDDQRLRPLVESKKLIEERIGTEGLLRLNPDVSDIPAQCQVTVAPGLSLMVVGAVQEGGGGCACSANVLVKSLIQHMLLGDDQDVLIDMEAGVEHLGRATVGRVDALLAVAEPTARSVETVGRIRRLASEIRLEKVLVIGNRIESEDDLTRLRELVAPLPVLGWAGSHAGVRRAEVERKDAYLACSEFALQIDEIRAMLLARAGESAGTGGSGADS